MDALDGSQRVRVQFLEVIFHAKPCNLTWIQLLQFPSNISTAILFQIQVLSLDPNQSSKLQTKQTQHKLDIQQAKHGKKSCKHGIWIMQDPRMKRLPLRKKEKKNLLHFSFNNFCSSKKLSASLDFINMGYNLITIRFVRHFHAKFHVTKED